MNLVEVFVSDLLPELKGSTVTEEQNHSPDWCRRWTVGLM